MNMSRLVFVAVASALLTVGVTAAEHKGLEGTNWQLLQLGPNGALATNLPTLTFAAGGKVSGSGGCNTFTGTATTSGMEIKIGPLVATKKSCSDEVNAQESAYLKALEQAYTFENRATSLLINTKAFNEPLSFIPPKG